MISPHSLFSLSFFKCEIELEFKDTKRVITGDCPSLDDCGITEVRSCKVIRGVWELCEGRDYTKPYVQLNRGECLTWGADDSSTPVLSIKHVTTFNIRLYEKVNFEGPMYEATADCPSLNVCGLTEVRSCKVISGVWKLFKGLYYTEPSYQLKKREYRSLEVLGDTNTALSVKRVRVNSDL